MCYLLTKPQGQAVPMEWIHNAFEAGNQDGFGLAFVGNKGKFVVKKTMDFARFCSDVQSIPLDRNAVVHLRMASTGVVCEDNCHPFHVGDMIGAHNGCLPGWGDANVTDTEHFMTKRIVSSHSLLNSRHTLEKEINTGKMAFLLPCGSIEILNRERGIEGENGFWHSNSFYQPYKWFGGPSVEPCEVETGEGLLDLIEKMEAGMSCVPESLKSRFKRLVSDLEAELYFYR